MSKEQTLHLHEWAEALDGLSYYQLLAVERSASSAQIKSAFHRFALAFHPDNYRQAGDDSPRLAERIFARGAEAYRVLRAENLRREYDLSLAQGFLRLAPQEVLANTRASAQTQGVMPARALTALCQTPAARLAAREAERLIHSGDLAAARRALMDAISKDGENPDLESRLDDLELALHAMGR